MTAPIRLTPQPIDPDPLQNGGQAPDLWKRAQMLDAFRQELDAWHARGGMIAPKGSPVPQGGIDLPGGVYGGEFSNEEMAAYNHAARQYEDMLAKHLAEVRLNRLGQTAASEATVPSDATATKRNVPLMRKSAGAKGQLAAIQKP